MEKGDNAIRDAFAKIKQDMDEHSSRISKLSSQSKKFDKFMLELRKDLCDLKQSISALEKQKSMPSTKHKITELHEIKKGMRLITNTQELYSQLKNEIELLKKEVVLKDKSYKNEVKKLSKELVGEVKRPSLKTKLIQGFDRNKKRILTKKILDVIAEKQLTLPELKTLVVDELGYCSKASFYRYFEALKKRKLVDFVELDDTSIIVTIKEKTSPT